MCIPLPLLARTVILIIFRFLFVELHSTNGILCHSIRLAEISTAHISYIVLWIAEQGDGKGKMDGKETEIHRNLPELKYRKT